MANDSSKGKHPRFFTPEEAREKFLAARAKDLAGEPIDADDSTAWHEVDNPLTSRQRKLITDAMPERGRYSPLVWLKLLEPGTDKVIRCRGRFNYVNGFWVAGFSEGEDDSGFAVSPIAWAPMNRIEDET
jgi:hypothetical protein